MNSRLKKIVFLVAFLAISLFVFSWVRSHGYIEISVTGADPSKTIIYTLTDGKSTKTTEVKTTSVSIKRLVSKSDYNVSVTQDGKSAVFLVRSSGFLGTASKSGTLSPENARIFVGSQPNTCMYYTDVLYSYDCGDEYSTLKLHLPATGTEPTYTKDADDIPVPIKGTVTTNDQPYIITQSTDEIDDGTLAPAVQPLRPDLTFSVAKELIALRGEELYSFQNYQQGFIAYNDSFSEIKYFTSLDSQPQTINIAAPKEKSVKPTSLSIAGSQIGAYFGERQSGFEVEDDLESTQKNKLVSGKSEFILYEGGSSRHYIFDTLYTNGTLCAPNRLCLTADEKLDIFDINGTDATHLFTVSDVKDAKYINQKLTVVTSRQIISLDDNLAGSALYSFGGYTFCGLSDFNNKLVVCVVAGDDQKNALLIDTANPNSDSIDKKMLSLSRLPYVNFISPYKNFIYVTQEAGEKEYNAQLGGFYYNRNTINKANEEILKEVTKLGIDISKYQIKLIY